MKKTLLSLIIFPLVFAPLASASEAESLSVNSKEIQRPAIFPETAKSTFSCLILSTHPAAEPCRVTISTTGHFNKLLVGTLSARESQGASLSEKSWSLSVGPRDINPAKSKKASVYLALVKSIRSKKSISFEASGRGVSPVKAKASLCSTCSLQPIKPGPKVISQGVDLTEE